MATYVKAFGGYIADVPKVWFKRCDGRIFHFDELTQASVTPNTQFTEITGGWSMHPVAYLPGQSTFEMALTSAKMEAELFAMANATKFEENTEYEMPMTEILYPNAEHKVTLAHVPIDGNVSIDGLQQGDQAASGVFSISEKEITFAEGDVADSVVVNYFYKDTVMEAKIDNKSTAMGEAVAQWPVYGAGDDCTDSAIIGYLTVHVYKCRVTAQPGFDSSYKSANSFQFTLGAMDAKRADDATYSIAYKRVA